MTSSDAAATGNVRIALDRVVRRERGRLIAGLVKRLGSHQLELAEDVAQDAVLTALSLWPYRGTPDNAGAWLHRVAFNKAVDRLRRERRELALDDELDVPVPDEDASLYAARIGDPELRLMFLCCHSTLGGIDQLVLTLRVVSGFSAREIGQLLLSREGTIAQRLARCKRKLRRLDGAPAEPPSLFEVEARLTVVLKVVYLMFSLGYAPRSGARAVRRDVAIEALRLGRELADGKATATPAAKALAALLCLQASRFDAREDVNGTLVLFRHQNRADWDPELVGLGLDYLQASMAGEGVTRYHLEAGIASIYATAPSWERIDWQAVLHYYEKLRQVADSPVVTINAAVAEAFAGEPKRALARLEALGREPALDRYGPYHIARAEVLRMLGREIEANMSYSAAIANGASTPVIRHLEARLASSL